MQKKSKVKSATGIGDKRRKSVDDASDNLYASLSFVEKCQKVAKKLQRKSRPSKSSSNVESEKTLPKVSRSKKPTSNVPKDAAVHFGSFYGVRETNKPQANRINNFFEPSTLPYKATPRLEFTRQMVHKLERTAGTKEYARQVSALLEETVEPANFKLHSLPLENSIPDGRHNPTGFPLWYKDPYKMSINSDEIYKLLKEKYDNDSKQARDIFEEDTEDDSSEGISDDGQPEDEENLLGSGTNRLTKEEKLTLNILSHEFPSVTETKHTNSRENDKEN